MFLEYFKTSTKVASICKKKISSKIAENSREEQQFRVVDFLVLFCNLKN